MSPPCPLHGSGFANYGEGQLLPERWEERTMRPGGPDDVDAHPLAAAAFGMMDLLGNTYEWTDQFDDQHTSRMVVRGGSYYQGQRQAAEPCCGGRCGCCGCCWHA